MPSTITPERLAGALRLRDLSDPRSGLHAMQLMVDAVAAAVEAEWCCPVAHVPGEPDRDRRRELRAARLPGRCAGARGPLHPLPGRSPAPAHAHDGHDPAGAPPDGRCGPRGRCRVSGARLPPRRRRPAPRRRAAPARSVAGSARPAPRPPPSSTEMVDLVVSAVLAGARRRTLPASHPYTAEGRELEVLVDGSWIELLECGSGRAACASGGGARPRALVGTRARDRPRSGGDAAQRHHRYPPAALRRSPCRRPDAHAGRRTVR